MMIRYNILYYWYVLIFWGGSCVPGWRDCRIGGERVSNGDGTGKSTALLNAILFVGLKSPTQMFSNMHQQIVNMDLSSPTGGPVVTLE